MNPIALTSSGLSYWKRIYDSLISSDWKHFKELYKEIDFPSLLFSNSECLICPPCFISHPQETFSHCLHCEELLQLSFFYIFLSKVSQDKQHLPLFRNLLTKPCLHQNLVYRVFAKSIYISHLASKVLVSWISINPFKCFTENGFEKMVLLFIDPVQPNVDRSRGVFVLTNLLRTKLPKDVNKSYVSALTSLWTVLISTYKEFNTDTRYNLIFLTFWRKFFKNINKNRSDFPSLELQMAHQFFLLLDFMCEKLRSSWRDDQRVYRTSLKLFCTVLNYEDKLSVEKTIPDIYHKICIQLLTSENFSQTAFSVSKTNSLFLPGNYSIQIHQESNISCDKDLKPITNSINRLLDMSILRRLILFEFNVCAIALRSEYLKFSLEFIDTNENVLEKILDKLQQMCLFINNRHKIETEMLTKQIINWLPQIFSDQDNYWIQVLLAATDLYIISNKLNKTNKNAEKISALIDPHLMFQQFLASLAYDSSVLLDLLSSPETCFLLYFLKYLKLLSQEWHFSKIPYQETVVDLNYGKPIEFHNECRNDSFSFASVFKENTDSSATLEVGKSINFYSFSETEEINSRDKDDCKVEKLENICKNSSKNSLEQSRVISEQHHLLEKLSIPNQLTGSTHLPDKDLFRTKTPLPSKLKPSCFTDFRQYKITPHKHQTVKNEDDLKRMKAKKEHHEKCHILGIGLSSIQVYSNSSEDEQEETSDNSPEEKHDLISMFEEDSKTKELIHKHQEISVKDSGSIFNDSFPKVPKTSVIDLVMLCLKKLLQQLKRLSKSSVFPYQPQPLINALETCVVLYNGSPQTCG